MALDDFNLNDSRYFTNLAAAFVRGKLGAGPELSPQQLIVLGRERGLRLHKFKCQTDLPRVKKFWACCKGWRLQACSTSAIELDDNSVDVVTALEVLEHMPAPQPAAAEAVRIARNFVVASVPSKEDDNPEHIQLFTRDSFEALWLDAGARSAKIEYVLNHMIAVVKV